jgi:hypothetical protein
MAAEKRKRKGFDYLSMVLLGEDSLVRAFSRVSQSVSWSLIPQGPPWFSEKTIGEERPFEKWRWNGSLPEVGC